MLRQRYSTYLMWLGAYVETLSPIPNSEAGNHRAALVKVDFLSPGGNSILRTLTQHTRPWIG